MIRRVVGAVVAVALVVGVGVYVRGRGRMEVIPMEPVASVQVTPLGIRKLSRRALAYGAVTGAPGDQWDLSKPFSTEISGVYVSLGQRVAKGQILLKVAPSPTAALAVMQARSTLNLARKQWHQTQRQYALRLATNADVLIARQRYETALIHWRSFRAWGGDRTVVVRAPVSGLVAALPVTTPGALVPRGLTLIAVTANRHLQAKFGVDPKVAVVLSVGQRITVSLLSDRTPAVEARVVGISGYIDPQTRLVDVFVALPPNRGFLVGQILRGQIDVRTEKGLVVPRSAVLPQGSRHVLYTVKSGRAVEHTVHIELRNHRYYEVSGEGLQVGDPVVVLGNYELRPGMSVRQNPAR